MGLFFMTSNPLKRKVYCSSKSVVAVSFPKTTQPSPKKILRLPTNFPEPRRVSVSETNSGITKDESESIVALKLYTSPNAP